MALRRGDRELAAEWYAVAARTYASGHDLRDVAEALVGLVATTDDPPERTAVRDRLAAVCVEGGITLLPGERALIRSSGAVPTASRRAGSHPVTEVGAGADDRRRPAEKAAGAGHRHAPG
jgi:hypothetical protein